MSELKINNIKPAGVPITPINPEETKPNPEDTLKDTLESPTENTPETKPTVTKHLVTYVGNGEFTDRHGYKWHRDNEQTYSDEEFEKRTDLQYMIQYGAMKHSIVTM